MRPLIAPARALVCGLVVVVLCALYAGSATAAPRQPSLVRLENSITPALSARARSAGTAVAAGARLHLTVTLKPRDPGALAAYANAVMMAIPRKLTTICDKSDPSK